MSQGKGGTDQLNASVPETEIVAHQAQEVQTLPSKITYQPVPRIPDLPGEAYIPRHWRIQLIGEEGNAMGLDVYDDVILGRGTRVRERAGIDFSEWGAEDKGVSREHALLRPTPTCLYLVDIGSTNGTYHNIEAITPGVARELDDGDVIVLSRLVLIVRIIHSPQDDLPLSFMENMPSIKAVGAARPN
jgi:hypothetical protein